ncbi:MAG: glycogen debranching protein [Cytophagales bacterium]|nr:MAG: glycogen debranching protein [Cytophagales bacterium]
MKKKSRKSNYFSDKKIDMSIKINKTILQNQHQSTDLEWLETNGLGGWAMGTLSGVNTRRYHGLLCASMKPPVERFLLLNKMAETISNKDGNFELDANNFNGVITPQGFQHLESYEQDLYPVFTYKIGDIVLKKSILMVYGENTTLVRYEVIEANQDFVLKLKPFIAFKDYHWHSKSNENIRWGYKFAENTLKVQPYSNMCELFITVPNSEFHYSPDWYYNFLYKIEHERGQDFMEDLFIYGEFITKLKKGQKLDIIISTQSTVERNASDLFDKQVKRKKDLLKPFAKADDFAKSLVLAADTFIVQREGNLKTIIAGYPWFADWGRDTMISLPGLCLTTKRFDDAKKILKAFAHVVNQGMIPNRFPDVGEEPEYNTVDATLWYFHAISEYLKASGDSEFITKELYPVLKEIIDWHIKGTRYGIKVDTDGLLSAGEPGTQLTWMDAKVGDWVVTPRQGKAVEINALWYNALCVMEEFATLLKDERQATTYKKMATITKKSFLETFTNERGTLYDVIEGTSKDAAIRPNMAFAVSLPHSMLSKTQSTKVLKEIEEHLLTNRGLRSISYQDSQYIPFYQGAQLQRDGSYHQGTVWSWPVGAYLEGLLNVDGEKAHSKVKNILKSFESHLSEAGIGTVSEIFDGNAPHLSKGCIAQAWGVAEWLRIWSKVNQ